MKSHDSTAVGRAGMLRTGEVSGAGSGELSLQCQRILNFYLQSHIKVFNQKIDLVILHFSNIL